MNEMPMKRIVVPSLVLLFSVACARVPDGAEPPVTPTNAKNDVTVAMFGGTPERNMVNMVEMNIPTEWSVKKGQEKNLKWTAQLGKVSYGGPVVAGGKVYVCTNNERPRDANIKGDKGILMCFDSTTGRFLWQAVHDKLANNDEDWPDQGIASTPAVEGNRVYYVNNRCELIAADTADGKSIWRLDMMKELGVVPRFLASCSPLVAGDLVFVVTGNGVGGAKAKVVAPKAPSFLAVNKATGKVVWSDNSPGDQIMEGQWSNPAHGVIAGKPQVIFPGGDGWLYAFEPATGKPIWKFDCNPKAAVFKVGGGGNRNYAMATPVVHDNLVYVSVGRNPEDGVGEGHLWCIDATKSGDISAEVLANGKPEPNKNSGVVWHYGGAAPEGAARDIIFGRSLSTCAVHDGLVYAAELDGFLHCLDARTGKEYWQNDLKTGIWSSPYWVDGKVYLGDDNGNVSIFAHGKELKLPATIPMGHAVKNPVTAVNGVLYIMTGTELYAITKGLK